MADQENAPQNQVSLDELLRLKRAERPDADFWDQFDRELHQRTLQTLVTKDPWHLQLVRGLTGRMAQTCAVGAAAVFLFIFALQPAFVPSSGGPGLASAERSEQAVATDAAPSPRLAAAGQSGEANLAADAIDFATVSAAAERDYGMEVVSALETGEGRGFTPEYAPDSIQVTTYDSSAYMMDTAVFAGSGLATGLVY